MLQPILVKQPSHVREFLEFPARLFKKDPFYIRPLNKDIEEVFDAEKNKFFQNGSCERFLFTDKSGKTVGKVAVFINTNYEQEIPTGGIGFFDCIEDQETANFIFDFCRNWLQQKGIEAMDGPINFGERDKFWGLLTEGFHEPLYGMNYNSPYYQNLFETYGFKPYYQQLCYGRKVHDPVSRVFTVMHRKHSSNPKITAKPLKKNQLKKFAKDFTEVYNKAWANHGDGKQLDESKTYKMFLQLKPIINEHISWFVYEDEQPIAMWMNIPDVNQWFKSLNGKFGIWEKLKFFILKSFQKNTKMVGLVFGVVPEWQKKGIDGFMIWEGTQHLRKHTDFQETELQWIGDFNPKMIKIAEHLDTQITRRLTTYRYLFDREKEFTRHPML